MKIILMGFEFESSNKGCEALSYSFLPFLERILKSTIPNQKIEIVNINIHENLGKIPNIYKKYYFKNIHIKLKDIKSWIKVIREVKKSDLIFDITHGDSFSDLYGKKWFIQTTLLKQIAITFKKPLILLPQTYGPFENNFAKIWAKKIIKKSYRIYSRDLLSTNYINELTNNKLNSNLATYTDLAFSLPYNNSENKKIKNNKIKVGINVSGLLWNDCKTKNKFGLKVDYCEYCYNLVEKLLKEDYEVYLVPHVICDEREGNNYFENDSTACKEILKKYPKCIYSSKFETAIDVKSYISKLDFLVAARMHASIAAYSSGCISIPFAYSRKFKGIYSELDYNYIIDGKELTTSDAVNKTIKYIRNSKELKEKAEKGMKKINSQLNAFEIDLAKCIKSIIDMRSEKNENID